MTNKTPPAWIVRAEIELMQSMTNLSIGTASYIAATFEQLVSKHAPDAEALAEALEELSEVCKCQNGCDTSDMTCASNKARATLAAYRAQHPKG